MAPNQGPSVFPVTVPTVLGDVLVLLALPIGFRNGSESRPIGFPNRSSNRTWRHPESWGCRWFLLRVLLPHLPCESLSCNLCGHLERRQMPDIENSRKTAQEGAEWVPGKVPASSQEQPQKQPKESKQLFFGWCGCIPAVLPRTHSARRAFVRSFPAAFIVGHLAPL